METDTQPQVTAAPVGTNHQQGASVEASSESLAVKGVGCSAWFAIRGDWLAIGADRYRLSAITCYSASGNSGTFWMGQRSFSVHAPYSEDHPWGSQMAALNTALDAYFANGTDQPR